MSAASSPSVEKHRWLNRPVAIILSTLGWTLAHLPRAAVAGFCRVLGWLTFHLTSRGRVVVSQLHHAFPERPYRALKRLAIINLGRMFELFLLGIALPHFKPSRIERDLKLPDAARRQLSDALARQGAVVFLPHVSLAEYLATLPQIFQAYQRPIGFLYRPLDFAPAARYLDHHRRKHGVELIARREGLLRCKDLLAQGGILAAMVDQNARDIGGLSLFFDRVVSTSHLPAQIALKYGAQAFLLFPRRTACWKGEIELIPLRQNGSVELLTAEVDYQLEERLKAHPSALVDWFWAHRRWKVLLAPHQRLHLHQKRDFLREAKALRGYTALPRRTRFWVFLPPELLIDPAGPPLLQRLWMSRPDGAFTWVAAASTLAHLPDARWSRQRLDLDPDLSWNASRCRALRHQWPDTILVLTRSAVAAKNAAATGAEQRLGFLRPGERKPGLSHAWKVPADWPQATYLRAPFARALLEHFGLPAAPASSSART